MYVEINVSNKQVRNINRRSNLLDRQSAITNNLDSITYPTAKDGSDLFHSESRIERNLSNIP